jgi:hypothetical protein
VFSLLLSSLASSQTKSQVHLPDIPESKTCSTLRGCCGKCSKGRSNRATATHRGEVKEWDSPTRNLVSALSVWRFPVETRSSVTLDGTATDSYRQNMPRRERPAASDQASGRFRLPSRPRTASGWSRGTRERLKACRHQRLRYALYDLLMLIVRPEGRAKASG